MLRFENPPASVYLSGLLAAAAALQEFSCNLQDLAHIPDILRKVLNARSVSLSLTYIHDDGNSEVLIQAACSAPSETMEPSSSSINSHAGAEQSFIYEHDLDYSYHMKLTVSRASISAVDATVGPDVLNILCNHLLRSLQALVGGLAYPPRLEAPFPTLTEREWFVLCGLDSDEAEKQIAERMHLSTHTLHSHIKSLYRKIGVRGRLALLQRFRRAWRDYRLTLLAQPLESPHASAHSIPQITVVESGSPFEYPAPSGRESSISDKK